VEYGVAACEHLLSKLADVPTPAGPTPHEIGVRLVQITFVKRGSYASYIGRWCKYVQVIPRSRDEDSVRFGYGSPLRQVVVDLILGDYARFEVP
jgi:hypothetical protein